MKPFIIFPIQLLKSFLVEPVVEFLYTWTNICVIPLTISINSSKVILKPHILPTSNYFSASYTVPLSVDLHHEFLRTSDELHSLYGNSRRQRKKFHYEFRNMCWTFHSVKLSKKTRVLFSSSSTDHKISLHANSRIKLVTSFRDMNIS